MRTLSWAHDQALKNSMRYIFVAKFTRFVRNIEHFNLTHVIGGSHEQHATLSICSFQKMLSRGALLKRYSEKFCKLHRKTPISEFLF